jgi:hypothetical protein
MTIDDAVPDKATQDAEQKVQYYLAGIKKGLDGFLEESGLRPEQVLLGRTYEQFLRDQEAKLRKLFKC